jgi:peptide deformylase
MIAMNLGAGSFLLINPLLSGHSADKFTMWDDCMSFPWLMVRVARHSHVEASFRNERGEPVTWAQNSRAVSELLQHEVDHLDGILALDRALDREAVVARAVYEAHRDRFDRQVDYVIAPTTAASKPLTY